MRFYTQQHRFYCGIDLHARSMFLCILDAQGREVFAQDLPIADGVRLSGGAAVSAPTPGRAMRAGNCRGALGLTLPGCEHGEFD